MYNLRPRFTRVNYRTLHGLTGNDMSASKHSESERDTEESQVPSDQDHEGHDEIPDETAEELEVLIARQESTLDNARQQVKLITLKKKLKELEKETMAEQLKLARATGATIFRSSKRYLRISVPSTKKFLLATFGILKTYRKQWKNASARWVCPLLPLQPQQTNFLQVRKATVLRQRSGHQDRNEVSGT